FAAALQEVIDRPGWSSGNAIMVIIVGRTTPNAMFRCVAYEGSSSAAASLHVEYTEPSGGDPQTINAAVGTLTLSGPQATVTPGAVSVDASTGALALSGPQATVTPDAVTINAQVGVLSLSGPQVTVTPGAVSVSANTGTLALSGPAATVTPGAVSVSTAAGMLNLSGPAAMVATNGTHAIVSAAVGILTLS